MSMPKIEPNPILDSALKHKFEPFKIEKGHRRVVAFGDSSHKCPTYVTRLPPCQDSCPAGEDIRGYNNLLTGVDKSDDRWAAAWLRIVDKNPFPSIMGRVCPHPCETGCNRTRHDESVAINAVEHAIGDYGLEKKLPLPQPGPSTGKKIAVVGGGPAGLSAAYQLRRMGHAVTIFDDREKLGGIMRYGILNYRVDRKVLDAEIQRIVDLGVTIRLNTAIGRDISLEDLKSQYDAVFLGIGAQRGMMLPVPGFGDSPDTTNALDILNDYELHGNAMHIGKQVLVVGDGNVSMDVVRLARRMGVSGTVLSAVPRAEMACYKEEYDEAVSEGAVMKELISVIGVLIKDGKVTGAKCVKMQKKEKGDDGFNSPVPFLRYKPVPGSEFVMDCDMVVASIGQGTRTQGFETQFGDARWLKVDKSFRVIGEEKVFGGGDVLKIDLITTAVGHGRKAAEAIDLYFKDQTPQQDRFKDVIGYDKLYPYYFKNSPQTKREHLHAQEIKNNFDEILKSPDADPILEEAKRCMSCGMCFSCKQCMTFCPQEAISYFKNNAVGEVMFTDYKKCVGCHICAEVCPTGFIQMGMGEGL
ncbi:MAG: NAD(P)-binding protein [Deltaproteobacteria bacterium]|nr:NAD(P)-binding protein [Deltaproteobacteria bacterium]